MTTTLRFIWQYRRKRICQVYRESRPKKAFKLTLKIVVTDFVLHQSVTGLAQFIRIVEQISREGKLI